MVEQLKSANYANAKMDHMLPSSYVTAQFLKQKHPEITKVHVIGH